MVGIYTEIDTYSVQYSTYTKEFYVSIGGSVPARVDDCIPWAIKVLAKSDWCATIYLGVS